MDINSKTPSTTIAMQEDAMWAEYFAQEAERLARIPAEEAAMWDDYFKEQQKTEPAAGPAIIEDHNTDAASLEAENGRGRFAVTTLGPDHLYPTDDKKKHTSKDRRYVHLTKFTDRDKALGKMPGRKNKSYRQLKQEGIPLGSV